MNSILSSLSSSIRNALAILLTVMVSALAMPASADTVTYYHNDLLGTPIAASDTTGKVIWRRAYDPFGAQVASTASTSNVRIDYTGHTKDAETGLVNMGARMYNPEIGMFYGLDQAAIDPHNEFSFNRYAYANQNPYRYVDPDGRDAVEYFVVVGLVTGATIAVASLYGNPDIQAAVHDTITTLSSFGIKGMPAYNQSSGTPKKDGEGATPEEIANSSGGPTAGQKVPKKLRDKMLDDSKGEDGTWTCWRCGGKTDDPSKIDIGHKNKPRSEGGNLHPDNLACEGQACNRSAGNRGEVKPGSSCVDKGCSK